MSVFSRDQMPPLILSLPSSPPVNTCNRGEVGNEILWIPCMILGKWIHSLPFQGCVEKLEG